MGRCSRGPTGFHGSLAAVALGGALPICLLGAAGRQAFLAIGGGSALPRWKALLLGFSCTPPPEVAREAESLGAGGAKVLASWGALGRLMLCHARILDSMGGHFFIGKHDVSEVSVHSEVREYGLSGAAELPPPVLFVDVGANVGQATVAFAKANPSAQLVCFEPMPVSRFYLELNLVLHGLWADIFAEAVGGQDGVSVAMKYYPLCTQCSSQYASSAWDHLSEAVLARTRRLEAALEEARGAVRARSVVMKLDCEGCEYEVVPSLSNATLDLLHRVVGEVHPELEGAFRPDAVRASQRVMCSRKWEMKSLVC